MIHFKAWRLLLGVVCLNLLEIAMLPVAADVVFWEGDINNRWHVGGNWSLNLNCGPVICFQVSPQPDDEARVFDRTFGNSVYLNANEQVQRLNIGNGMIVNTDGFHLDAGGGLVSPLASLDISGSGSSLRVIDAGSSASDLYTSRFHLRDGGNLRLNGSPQVEVTDAYSFIDASSSLYGNGTVRFSNTLGTLGHVLRNHGAIIVRSNDLTLTAENGGSFDLDGTLTTGVVDVDDLDNVASRNLTLTVDGPLVGDTFDGTMRIGKGDRVHFTHDWNLGRPQGPGALVEMNARDRTATLSGAFITMNDPLGRIEVQSGTARFEAGMNVFAGTLAISNNTTVDFAAYAAFSATAGTIDKSAAADHEMIVRDLVAINQPDFDWDGSTERHVTSIRGGELRFLSDRIEPIGPNVMDGTVNIIGEPTDSALLFVDEPWFMNGTMHLDGTHNVARVYGSAEVMHVGDRIHGPADAVLLVDGPHAEITATVEFEDDARTTLNANSRLRLTSTSKIADGAQFSGPGELFNDNGTLTIDNGATIGVRLVNNGSLAMDNTFGSGPVGVAEFEQTMLGQWDVKLRSSGNSDKLQVTTSAQLDGALSVVSAVPRPVRGTEFTILTAANVSGEFAHVGQSGLGPGDAWRVLYEPNAVILKVTSSGDFNIDGNFDCLDVDALVLEIASATNNLDFDVTGDGNLNTADLVQWLTDAGATNLPSGNAYLLGDANLDGVVDAGDFVVWNSHKFTANAAWCGGDFNADGFVDGTDFGIWNANKFTSALLRQDHSPGRLTVVPEPASCVLLLVGMLAGRVRQPIASR